MDVKLEDFSNPSPFDRLPESHQGRVRSEVARLEACREDVSLPEDAFASGFRAGWLDFGLEHCSHYSWNCAGDVGNPYACEYGKGYRKGWLEASRHAAQRIPE